MFSCSNTNASYHDDFDPMINTFVMGSLDFYPARELTNPRDAAGPD